MAESLEALKEQEMEANATYARLHQQITDRGPWQQTASGKAFFLADPRPEEVDVNDIAHALSHQCRYNGHCREFYSIAQHACFVSKALERDGYPLHVCYAGLHHDSAEAYTGDIVSQVKHIVPAFRTLEDRVEAVVFQALGVSMTPAVKSIVKDYDMLALSTERRDVLSKNETEFTWGNLPEPREDMHIHAWVPGAAELIFKRRHKELCVGITKGEGRFDVV